MSADLIALSALVKALEAETFAAFCRARRPWVRGARRVARDMIHRAAYQAEREARAKYDALIKAEVER